MTLFYPFRGTKVSPGGTDGKENACNAGDPSLIPGSGRSPEKGMATCSTMDPGDPGSIPGLGRSPGEGNGYSLQHRQRSMEG